MLRDEPRFICFCTLLLEVCFTAFTAPREVAAITVGPLPLRKGVSRRSSIRPRERDFGVHQRFPTELVVVNSINFGTAALVVLTVPVMTQLRMLCDDGFRCHGNEQRMAAVKNSRKTVQLDEFVRFFFLLFRRPIYYTTGIPKFCFSCTLVSGFEVNQY